MIKPCTQLSATLALALSLVLGLAITTQASAKDGGAVWSSYFPEDLTASVKNWDDIVWWQRKANVIEAKDAPGGKRCMKFVGVRPNYTLISRVLFFPEDVTKVFVRGEAKAENIKPGPNKIDRGRVVLQFLDEHGDMVGKWQKGPHRCEGTTDWTYFDRLYIPPKNTRAVRVMAGTYLSTGTLYVRDLRLEAFDKEGNTIKPLAVNQSITETADWAEFKLDQEDPARPLVYDFSGLNPAPAGKDGFVRAENGHFYLADGRRIRFWGTNEGFHILEKSKEELRALAEHYQRNGMNMVRLHHMDNGWSDPLVNIFDPKADDTQTLHAERMDKQDYFVAECKKRGIYIFMDLMCNRKFKAGDNVRDWQKLGYGARVAGSFNRRIIELQKHFATLYLDRKNPYTGLKYNEDPAIAMLDIANETNMFWLLGYSTLPKSYLDELDQLFAEWCVKNNVKKPQGDIKKLIAGNDRVTFKFLLEVQNNYFDEMRDYLRKDVKFKGLITGSNHWDSFSIELFSNARYDYIDRHSYWDHPQGGFTPKCNFINESIIKKLYSKTNNPISYLSTKRVKGKPMFVSEWCFCWPNEYITEGGLLMAAQAAFQDWDGMLVFFLREWADKIKSSFDPGDKPHARFPIWAMSITFLRGDIKPGPETILKEPIPETAYVMGKNISPELPLKRRIATEFVKGAKLPEKSNAKPAMEVTSDDGQLYWNIKEGQFKVNTPKTQAFSGAPTKSAIKLKDIELKLDNEFGQVIAVSLDNKPLADSSRMLICATARCENTGQVFKLFRKSLKNIGTGPILTELVKGTVKFTSPAKKGKKAVVYAVDSNFRRIPKKLPMMRDENGTPVMDLGKEPWLAFEVCWE